MLKSILENSRAVFVPMVNMSDAKHKIWDKYEDENKRRPKSDELNNMFPHTMQYKEEKKKVQGTLA